MSDIPNQIFKKTKKKNKIEIPKQLFYNNKKIPELIKISFKNNVELDKIDEIIKHKFTIKKANIKDLQSELDELEYIETNTRIEEILKNEKIEELKNEINDYQNNISLNKYISESEDYLKRYNDNLTVEERLDIIDRYLRIAKKYIKIEIEKIMDNKFYCQECLADLDELKENKEGLYICPYCNTLNQTLLLNSYSRDLFLSSGSANEDVMNFIKVLDKFEGKNYPHPPDKVYDDLDNYFKSVKFMDRETILNLPLNDQGRKDGTSKKILLVALEKTGNNAYYEEVNYVAYRYWGWKLPDIRKYRQQLINDYQETQKVWKRIRHLFDRRASLGTQFRLYVQLKAIGYDVKQEDFKIQDSTDSLRIHNEAWRMMCEETNIKYYEVN